MKQYLVIGLGRFGTGVAKTLYEAEKNVLAIDIDEDNVQDKIDTNIIKNAVIGDPSDEKVLKDIGAENFDVAFICMGDIEASVMIALNLKELGIKTIIAKAINKKHGKILTKVGATEIVYPEEHMGKRIAELTIDTDVKERLKFSDNFVLVEVKAKLEELAKTDPDAVLAIDADENTPYEHVAKVLEVAKDAGISKIAFRLKQTKQ